jgi:hypothetical protein
MILNVALNNLRNLLTTRGEHTAGCFWLTAPFFPIDGGGVLLLTLVNFFYLLTMVSNRLSYFYSKSIERLCYILRTISPNNKLSTILTTTTVSHSVFTLGSDVLTSEAIHLYHPLS